MTESVAVAKEADAKKGVSPTRSDNSIPRVRDEPERQLGSLRGVIGNIRRDGCTSSVKSIATQLSGMHTTQRAPVLLALQRTHGNRYVQRVVAGIQAKLVVGQPGDIYEQEADRVAEQVMRMAEPQVQRQFVLEEEEEETLQTKPLANEITPLVQRQTIKEEEEEIQTKILTKQITPLVQGQVEVEEEEPIMTTYTQASADPIGNDLQIRLTKSRGSGQPLPERDRSFMERRFGADFSGVRVHTDSNAEQMNRELNARAFTHGRDIYFGASRYNPCTSSGKRLLAHELTHVVQQNGDQVQRKLTIGQPGDRYEQEADQVAQAIMQEEQQPVLRESDEGLVHRQVEEEEEPIQAKSEDAWIQRQEEVPEEEEIVQTKTNILALLNRHVKKPQSTSIDHIPEFRAGSRSTHQTDVLQTVSVRDQIPTSQGNTHAQRILASGSRATAAIVQREVVRNDVVNYTYIPDGRLPHGIVVDLYFSRDAGQGQISRDLIIALRRWVKTQEQDRSPGLVNARAFQSQLRLYLDGYRRRYRPSIRGEWEYRIYIQLNRNHDPATRYRVDSIAIDTRRHRPIPQPERPEGPSREEREGWIDRVIGDRDVAGNVRRMLTLHQEGHLDGLYQIANRVNLLVQISGLTPFDVTQRARDANDDISNGVDHAIDYEAFKRFILDIRPTIMRGINRIHFHDSAGAPITTLAQNAVMIHEWVWDRQPNRNSVYGIFYPRCVRAR